MKRTCLKCDKKFNSSMNRICTPCTRNNNAFLAGYDPKVEDDRNIEQKWKTLKDFWNPDEKLTNSTKQVK